MLYLVIILALVLVGCAALPPADFQSQVTARVAELTAKFNGFAGTNYDPPPVKWFSTPAGEGALEGQADAGLSRPITSAGGPQEGAVAQSFSGYYVQLNTVYANLDPKVFLSNTIPHELAHVFATRYYGGPQGHNGLWQRIAVLLGVPRTDPYITDPALQAGGF